jgi:hypothetical protein
VNPFQLFAFFLAIGAAVWGLFCSYFLIFGDRDYSLLLFGPGYLVLVGYIWRCIVTPPIPYRVIIWGVSALLQGAWLVWGLMALWHDGARFTAFQSLALCWWLGSFSISVYGLIADKEEKCETVQKPVNGPAENRDERIKESQ